MLPLVEEPPAEPAPPVVPAVLPDVELIDPDVLLPVLPIEPVPEVPAPPDPAESLLMPVPVVVLVPEAPAEPLVSSVVLVLLLWQPPNSELPTASATRKEVVFFVNMMSKALV